MDGEPGSSLRWYRIQVHAVEREGVGFYACWHVTASGRAGVDHILMSFARQLGFRSIEIDEMYEEDAAKAHEQVGIRQDGGRVFYDETVDAAEGEAVYKVQRWPFRAFAMWSWNRQIRRFNSTLRSMRDGSLG